MRSYRLAALLLFVVLGVLAGLSVAANAGTDLNQLSGPLSVIHVGELRDGGTLTLALADPCGVGNGVLFNDKHGSTTQGRPYADGHLVPLGSAAQQRVLAAITQYMSRQFTLQQLSKIANPK